MKFKDLKLSTNLHITFIVIYLVVIIMGGISWYQANTLWQQTQRLYEHPLKVRRALNGLEFDIIAMDNGLKEYVKEKSSVKKQNILLQINQAKVDINRRFRILSAHYLGPQNDIQKVEKEFYKWNVLTGEVIARVQAGNDKNALEILSVNNGSRINTKKLLDGIHSIGLFATKKADQFYQKANTMKSRLSRQLFLLLGIILILLLLFTYFLIRHIRYPIKELTQHAKKFSEGNYEARVTYTSKSELGMLSTAFNQLAATIQSQLNREQKAFRFNTTLFEREDLNAFVRSLTGEIVEITQSQMGAFYLLNKDKTKFKLFESIGLSQQAKTSFSAGLKEGEFGKALVEKKIIHLQEIPEDTSFVFATASGEFKPREIITLPVLEENKETVAVISLASLYPYTPETIHLLQDIYIPLTNRINGVLLFHQIKEQASQLKKQNDELELQEKELSAQTVELNRQNTELKMQKNQLDEANRLKSTFLSNMSHELRTPLNSVIALSSVLKRKLKTAIPAEEYNYIDVIERNGKQLMELINDVLDLSRIESGRVEIEQEEINIKDLINGMVTLIEPQAGEKNIRLKSLIKEELPLLKSDGNKIRHILQNLIGNAVKFTEKGKVEVTAFEKDGFLHIDVSDTGIGIPDDQIPFIFDEFRQVDSSTSRKYGGTGLGLSIAKKYANMLGGTIQVKSTEGKGSVFTLILPLKTANNVAISEPPLPPPVALYKKPVTSDKKQTGEKTILVVEDSEPAIIQLKDILQEAGFQIVVAHNGREALEKISKVQPDAMILDLMMPEIDGFQVLQAVRANVDTAHLPVLVLTAKHLEGKDLKNLKQNQVYQLIQKGDINREQLLHIINDMVFAPEKTEAQKPETTKEKPKKHKTTKTTKGEKPLILVVEDNVDNLLTIKTLLGEDYRVIEAYDGQDGINKAKTHRPDLILMDIAMPVMNGFRAFDAIRKEKPLKHIPIVAVTASALTADREEILHYGFDGYISKPIDIDQFDKTIQSFFEKK